eukprot:8259097-Karenia_brevis.AAC.1
MMQPGKVLAGSDLQRIVKERMETWQNPFNSQVVVNLASDLRPVETVRKGKGGGKGRGRGQQPPSSS